MNATEKRVIANVVKSLRGENRASMEVRFALTTPPLKGYLGSWVIPALELLIKEDRSLYDLRLADETAR